MRIIHLSYARVKSDDPERWLEEISFFTGILNEQAKKNTVMSIHCLLRKGIVVKEKVEYHFLKRTIIQIIFPFAIHRYVTKLKPEVVLVHGLHFGWQILWLRLQLGNRTRIFVQHHAEKPHRFPKNWIQKIADYFIEGYFFVSQAMARPWVEAKQIKSPSKVHEVMEASSTFSPMSRVEAKRQTQARGDLIYLWVGRLDANKDPLILIKAFKKFARTNPSVRLYIIYAGGNLKQQIKEQLEVEEGHSSCITLVGSVPHSELLYWFNSSDFVISTSHYEGSGIAVCEAMSCGCIPIITNIPSFKMMTNNEEAGILFPAGDETLLYNALINSLTLNHEAQHQKTRHLFETNLSFEAIASRMALVMER